jgi:hypothetical protein
VAPDIEKRTAKKPVRRPLPEHLEVVEGNRPALPFGWGRNGLDWWL